MTLEFPQVTRPGREELGRVLLESRAMAPDWAPTFAAVDRSLFLPDLIWPFDMGTGQPTSVSRSLDPHAWYRAVDSDMPIVTQWDDGRHRGTEPGRVSTSSSSMPSVVYSLLQTLEVDRGMRVLDVGTGTGETAGALHHRCGHGRVTTIEVDPAVSRGARERLCAAGLYPEIVVGDGARGNRDRAPYDRVLATVGLRRIPGPWIEQTSPGGVVVAPWGTHFSNADAVVRLVVGDRRATGRFTGLVEFMKLRSQRSPVAGHAEYLAAHAMADADTSVTSLAEEDFVTGKFSALPFALGLLVSDCTMAVAGKRDGARPVWFYGLTDRSWAVIMFRDGKDAAVWQSGPRRLWDETESAYRWWVEHDRPGPERFGLTVSAEGRQFVWLDEPSRPLVPDGYGR